MSNTKSKRIDPRDPASLEDFMETVAEACRLTISAGESPSPQVFVILDSGEYELYVSRFANITEKRAFQRLVKSRCLRMGVAALIAVTDCWWMRAAQGSVAADLVEMEGTLENNPHRCEAVMATVCTRQGYYWRAWPYERTADGIQWLEPEQYDESTEVRIRGNEWDPWAMLRRGSN